MSEETIIVRLDFSTALFAGVASATAISATLPACVAIGAGLSAMASIVMTVPITAAIGVNISSAMTISASLPVCVSVGAVVEESQLALVFSTPDNRLVRLSFTARYNDQEVWRFVGIQSGPRFND